MNSKSVKIGESFSTEVIIPPNVGEILIPYWYINLMDRSGKEIVGNYVIVLRKSKVSINGISFGVVGLNTSDADNKGLNSHSEKTIVNFSFILKKRFDTISKRNDILSTLDWSIMSVHLNEWAN